tara:strand:- start:11761 stop:12198 length:438 start_codon:yes stop_codon:yes gene_type:complete
MKLSKSIKKMINLDIVVALVLAILITFELKVEEDLRQFMNSALGLVSCLLILVVMFVYLNPLVGLLFLVYFYENIKFDNVHSGLYDKYTNKNILDKLTKSRKVTQKKQDSVEIETIKRMAPIVQKKEKMLSFKANNVSKHNYKLL